eukprot:CAMPEP_0119305892 /NCGR_PEP_ID=MMETSP1333-20130426/6774_1 /TAXON_ID=418940 /ORGANISM="Scyphosphaera apsteinii, Strain RCC1455" /LENGTH=379 /DNA_ID=CAMNT_0007309083 /DNA_START=48 /DNA_END=1187 /DNA_ORIENTATION=-
MTPRQKGLLIAIIGTLGATPDAMLLRLMKQFGGSGSVITVWRFVTVGTINFGTAVFSQGGLCPLLNGLLASPCTVICAALLLSVSSTGFVVSLLEVDPAKALLLISLNPLWAALLGYMCLNDELPTRTMIAQAMSLLSITLVFAPDILIVLGPGSSVRPSSEILDIVPLFTGVSMACFLTFSRWCSLRSVSDAALDVAPSVSSLMIASVAFVCVRQLGANSLFLGLQPGFWLTLLLNSVGICAYNIATVVAPRFLPGAEVALVLLGETVVGPLWVLAFFGVVPSVWTLAGGALLLGTLVWHGLADIQKAHEVPGSLNSSMSSLSSPEGHTSGSALLRFSVSPVVSPRTQLASCSMDSLQEDLLSPNAASITHEDISCHL